MSRLIALALMAPLMLGCSSDSEAPEGNDSATQPRLAYVFKRCGIDEVNAQGWDGDTLRVSSGDIPSFVCTIGHLGLKNGPWDGARTDPPSTGTLNRNDLTIEWEAAESPSYNTLFITDDKNITWDEHRDTYETGL